MEQKQYKDVKLPKGTICLCCHCGERFGGNAAGACAMYCSSCKTAEGRRKVDEENNQIRQENVGKKL